jgi:hypothetical protein
VPRRRNANSGLTALAASVADLGTVGRLNAGLCSLPVQRHRAKVPTRCGQTTPAVRQWPADKRSSWDFRGCSGTQPPKGMENSPTLLQRTAWRRSPRWNPPRAWGERIGSSGEDRCSKRGAEKTPPPTAG